VPRRPLQARGALWGPGPRPAPPHPPPFLAGVGCRQAGTGCRVCRLGAGRCRSCHRSAPSSPRFCRIPGSRRQIPTVGRPSSPCERQQSPTKPQKSRRGRRSAATCEPRLPHLPIRSIPTSPSWAERGFLTGAQTVAPFSSSSAGSAARDPLGLGVSLSPGTSRRIPGGSSGWRRERARPLPPARSQSKGDEGGEKSSSEVVSGGKKVAGCTVDIELLPFLLRSSRSRQQDAEIPGPVAPLPAAGAEGFLPVSSPAVLLLVSRPQPLFSASVCWEFFRTAVGHRPCRLCSVVSPCPGAKNRTADNLCS